MASKKGGNKIKGDQIFEQPEEYEMEGSYKQDSKRMRGQNQIKDESQHDQEQQGQILDEQESSGEQIILNQQEQLQVLNKNKQNQGLYEDSSEQDNERLQKQKKKRQQFWKHKSQKNEEIQSKKPLTEAQLLQVAFGAMQKTNKRVALIRKKNQKRMQDLQKIRMAQQPYLTTGNTHFRGSSSEYSIITFDDTGKTYYHPNHSFKVGEMRLQNFILKNIKQESTANYLNQVVKFQNYAYQQRKKRRHNIQ